MPRGRRSSVVRWVLVTAALSILLAPCCLADRIVLRNLDVISDKSVSRFDADGVVLEDDTIITWDQIEKGRVAAGRQGEFDRLLEELGAHLYRIRQRLTTGDYRGLSAHAEALARRYEDRHSATAYMVMQSLMWARLANGRREASLAPYLWCYDYLRTAAAAGSAVALPGTRRLRVDQDTGMTPDLAPVWFDAEEARAALPDVTKAIARMKQPRPPGARIYFGTLALAAGEPERASQALSGLQGLDDMMAVIGAQTALARGDSKRAVQLLEGKWTQFDSELQPLALYWLGQARLADNDANEQSIGILDLLRIPAVYGKQQPELAAAGLFESMQVLARQGKVKQSITVRRELLDRYGQTWHAARVRAHEKETEKQP